jgi:hypothetical protein
MDVTDVLGFGIGPNNEAIAALTTTGQTTTSLYVINLTTGAATSLGTVAGTETLRALVIRP